MKLKILDPACGAGELLVAAQRLLGAACSASLFGIDIDPAAVGSTRQRLCVRRADRQVCVADALLDATLATTSFDAVIANPPFVNIRELARQRSPAYIARLRERFQTARGNFDLYVLFIERALQWLRPGGRCGLILPNKWATLDYARPCRELLLEQATIDDIVDLSSQRVFREASVYPHLLLFTKRPPAGGAAVRVNGRRSVPQDTLSADSFIFGDSLPVESQVATQPLGSLVRLSCGTPGYAAAKIGSLLAEADSALSPALPFITSGNIDRYAVRTGDVRYQSRLWRDPRLRLDGETLTSRQRQQFQSPKIVIAGMSRRLEAAWDSRGLALGVQVFAATELQVDPFYLLALLNSKLLSYLFRTRFAAKRLSGGYLAINKGQLTRLPIVIGADRKPAARAIGLRLAELAKERSFNPQTAAMDEEIDRLVERLYGLTASQRQQVKAHFAEPTMRPAAA
jgi:SAM-dependent methyltransferase